MTDTHMTLPQTDIEFSSFRFTGKGLEAVGKPTIEEWITWGKKAHTFTKHMHFAIGDWLTYGEFHWKETYEQALKVTGFDIQTLRNDKWVASRIPPERRVEELSFSHHKEVADMDEETQVELLLAAVQKKLTRDQFIKFINKQEMRNDNKPKAPIQQPSAVTHALAAGKLFLQELEKLDHLSYNDYMDVSELLQDIAGATANITYEATNTES